MARPRQDADEKDAGSKPAEGGKKAKVSEMEDLELRVAHLEAATGTSYHPTPEEVAEQEEAAAAQQEEMAEEAEKAAAEAAEEAEPA